MDIKPSAQVNGKLTATQTAKSVPQSPVLTAPLSTSPKTESVSLSATSQISTEDFDAAVKSLQEDALSGFSCIKNGQFGMSANIDIGRYNLHLVDQRVESLQKQYGEALDSDALKKQLVELSGIETENPLKGSNRQDIIPENSILHSLKEKDVQALTDIYIYARENDLDTDQIDGLSFMIGLYRHGQVNHPDIAYPIRETSDTELEQQARAIYSSPGSDVVKFEQGFLDFALNPDKRLLTFSKIVDMDFMEKITGTGAGDAEFLPTRQYKVGKARITGPEAERAKVEQALNPDEKDLKNLSPEEALQYHLTNWIEAHIQPDSPLRDLLEGLPHKEQARLFSQMNLIDLL